VFPLVLNVQGVYQELAKAYVLRVDIAMRQRKQ